jgi:hypothetical protein
MMYVNARLTANTLWARLDGGHDPISHGIEIQKHEGRFTKEMETWPEQVLGCSSSSW